MLPVVQVLRSPATRGNSASIAASSRTAVSPASSALRHCRAACMVLLPRTAKPPLPDRDDACDHADAKAGLFELCALLDMQSKKPLCRPGSS